MPNSLKMCIWNANGLSQHRQEVQSFLSLHNIDIMLISETRFTSRNYFKIPHYEFYDTKHPSGAAHGGTAILIKKSIKHYEIPKHPKEYIQATSINVEDWRGSLVISAIYCPPKHKITSEYFEKFFHSLGKRFIAGGDYNAKHQQWGSRLNTTRGRELLKAMARGSFNHKSAGEPTYWPTDRRKIPDLIDFCVTKGIGINYLKAESCLELSSDHSPVLITLSTEVCTNQKLPVLCNRLTDWTEFRQIIDSNISCNIALKSQSNIDQAIYQLCNTIQEAAWATTPELKLPECLNTCPKSIKEKIAEKRKLRKRWQITRAPSDKKLLNQVTKQLKNQLNRHKNESIEDYLSNLSATEATDYSLWKATRKLKNPQITIPPIRDVSGNWARSNKEKALVFANHLEKVFQPIPDTTNQDEQEIHQFLEAPHQLQLPPRNFTITEVTSTIFKNLNPKKSPGYDLITGRVLQELTPLAIRLITLLFNAVLRLNYFPDQWKVAQIILIKKPGKASDYVESYRPISLLPILSKVFEKLLITRLRPLLANVIPKHQFGFRQQHSTVEQIHRITDKIGKDFEAKRYCSAVFLDISQAFDKVWHIGLLYKLKKHLPYQYYELLKSYLQNRKFLVRFQCEQTKLFVINSGVPQGSVLGPMLYLLYTADMPTSRETLTATFADDTAILASHYDPAMATQRLQNSLNKIQTWLHKWRIKVNEDKSTHITFTTRKETCPPVLLNNQAIPQKEEVKYLGMHLDRRLTWHKHIFTKRKQLGIKFTNMYWLIGRKSQLNLENKLLLYKSILKPVWTYGIQLWGVASNSNIEILQRFQSKVLRCIVNAPWFVPNYVIQRDLNMSSVKEEIQKHSVKYSDRLSAHPNQLAVNLLDTENDERRLKRFKPMDLSTRFN